MCLHITQYRNLQYFNLSLFKAAVPTIIKFDLQDLWQIKMCFSHKCMSLGMCVYKLIFTVHQCNYINLKISMAVKVLQSISNRQYKTFFRLRKSALEHAFVPILHIMTKSSLIFSLTLS